jgi:L,D-transpeptidase ErfK/SrfK
MSATRRSCARTPESIRGCPGEGKTIVVPTQFVLPSAPREGVIINVAAMRIYYFPAHKAGEPPLVYTHPIGIGKVGWKTPEGVTKITRRQKDPIWHVPVSVIKEHKENGEDLDQSHRPGSRTIRSAATPSISPGRAI